MIKPIITDTKFLSKKTLPATKDDTQIGIDLRDTLRAHKDSCAGLAANMIGYPKSVICFSQGSLGIVQYNPRIVDKSVPYTTSEGCLSLPGERTTTRYANIVVEYQDANMNPHKTPYEGYVAEIIQHEIDHCNGVLI